jgi:hypothetical protein
MLGTTISHYGYIRIVPFWAWETIIIVIITYLNLRGIKATALADKVFLAFTSLVI